MPDRLISAVFLDRDGVINRRRLDHVKRWAEFAFLPGALTALAELRAIGTPVVIVTNQSAVGRGLLAKERLVGIHLKMLRAIEAAGGHVSAIYTCIHAPIDGCDCRKPRPGLFFKAAAELGIDLNASIMVGDSPTDVAAAQAAGVRPVLVTNAASPLWGGPGRGSEVYTVTDLSQVVRLWHTLAVPVAALPC